MRAAGALTVHKIHQPGPLYMTAEEAAGIDVRDGTHPRRAGDRLPASYINFYIANRYVVMPLYDKRRDAAAVRAIRRLFPTRKVVGIETREVLLGGGNIHCITQQVPRDRASLRAPKGTLLAQRALESLYSTQPQRHSTGKLSCTHRLSKILVQGRERARLRGRDFRAPAATVTGNISDYGIAWVTRDRRAGADYTTYVVTIDSITLTRNDNTVSRPWRRRKSSICTQIHNIAEMWSSGAMPERHLCLGHDHPGLHDRLAVTCISVREGNVPVPATRRPPATTTPKAAPTTYAITVQFDPQNQPTITPTYASTSACLDGARFRSRRPPGVVDTSTSHADRVRAAVLTIGHQPADTKLIRVRGPLANSSTDVNTYTVYIRPFYDEANNIGQVTLFSQPNTVYTLNGSTYVGNAGLDALSVLSAGSTMTAGFTTFQPDYNPLNGAYAGRFNLQYVVAGSTLEDNYTEGISGDVIARNGNMLTMRGSTLILTTADTFAYSVVDCNVVLGAGTLVTADDNPLLKNLTPSSIAVGDHVTARGIYEQTPTGTCGLASFGVPVVLNSTGTSATNTGSVRLQQAESFGTLVSSAAGSLVMDLTSHRLLAGGRL